MEVVGSKIVTFHYEDMKGLKEDETGIIILVKILTFISQSQFNITRCTWLTDVRLSNVGSLINYE